MHSEGRGAPAAASSSSAPSPPMRNNDAPPPAPHMPAADVDASSSSNLMTRLEILSTRIPNFYIAPVCGASAGVASGIVTCPLDVIKTKLQAQGGFARRGPQAVEAKTLYRGMLGTGRMIFREDGIRGLYQGLGPMVLGYLPTWAVYLAVYDRSRDYFYDQTGTFYLHWCGIYNNILTPLDRKLVALPRLCINHGWRMLNHRDEPDLGYQDPAHVTESQAKQRGPARAMAISKHLGRGLQDVQD